jgi:hypothetical protein
MSKVRLGAPKAARSKGKGVSKSGGSKAAEAGRKAPSTAARKPVASSVVLSPASPTKGPPGTAAVLAIGDEILRGETANSNAAFLSSRLFDAGFEVRAHQVVSDHPSDIRAALLSLKEQASVILATGGLGPRSRRLAL